MSRGEESGVLGTRDLTCGIDGCAIVSDVSVDVTVGAMVAIVGENGSGKSTLLRTMAGLIKPVRGIATVQGQVVHALRPRARARQIAFVGQEDLPAEELQVWQAVALGLVPYQLPWDGGGRHEKETVLAALDHLGMRDFAFRRCDHLSGGERRRVILARGLVQRSEVLILDEPTNHLDIRHQLELVSVLRGSGRTIVAAIHDLNLALSFFDHVVVLHNGCVLAQGAPIDVLTPDVVGEAFGVNATVVRDHTHDSRHLALRPGVADPIDQES